MISATLWKMYKKVFWMLFYENVLSTAFLTKMRDILWKLQEQTFCEVVTVSPTIFIKEAPKHVMTELLHKRLNCCKK